MIKDYSYYYTLPEERYEEELKLWYRKLMGEPLDLENPRTFNEKIQWLKLYDSTPLKTQLADKYLVRSWVKDKIGEEYLIPLLGVWDSFDEIDFSMLPDQFVLKATHGSGWNYIVKNKAEFDVNDAYKKFSQWLREDFSFCNGLELHYTMKPRIIAEKYIEEFEGGIRDYRYFCFNGEPRYVWVDEGSGTKHHTRSIFDIDWNLQQYLVNYPPLSPLPNKPERYNEMCEFARRLCNEFAFVRVDFYNIKGKIYFGEMTFTPQSGRGVWQKREQNIHYGDLIRLPTPSVYPARSPIVSAILASYSLCSKLHETLDSLLSQSLKGIEILCTDDHSDEVVSAELASCAQKDARIRIVDVSGLDAATARNTAFDAAQGEFVMFINADGALDKELLMTMARRIIDQRADAVICNGTYVRRESEDSAHTFALINPQRMPLKDLFSSCEVRVTDMGIASTTLYNKMFRRAFLEKKKLRFEGMSSEDDRVFALTAMNMCERITVVKDKLLTWEEKDEETPALLEDLKLLQREWKDADSKKSVRVVLDAAFVELKKAGGKRYELLYKEMKGYILPELGLTKMTAKSFEQSTRYLQFQAMLKSEIIIRFE